MASFSYYLPDIAHVLIGFFYLYYGIMNIYQWRPTLTTMANKRIPHPYLFLSIGIIWQFTAGLLICFGMLVKIAALSLIPFTLIAVFIFHDFWNHHEGELRRESKAMFISNLTVTLGALVLLLNNVAPIMKWADLLT